MGTGPRLRRPAWFEIDLDAAAENLRTVRRLVGPERNLFAVLKADAYGFGAVEMAEVFAAHGADAFAVADLEEGIRLRRRGVTLPILLYPSELPELAGEVVAHRLTPTLTDLGAAHAYSRAAPAPYPVFVKVDVGLQRLGIEAEQAPKAIRAMLDLPRLRLGGVCTHLHVPARTDPAYVEWQFARFTAVLDAITADGVEVPIRLAASSPLVLRFPATYLNAVDPGRALYGIPARDSSESAVPLRPAFRGLKTRLIAAKDVAPRERFTDAAPFPVSGPMRVGVIPFGVADGLGALHAGRALVRGRSVPILARPSLEHTRLDLTTVPEAGVGDEVVLIGRQGTEEIPLAEVASRHGVEPVHLAPVVGPRVARVYYRNDAPVEVRTQDQD